MAQRVSIELVDDLDGKKADETVSFALDGYAYEIDLSAKNAEKLRGALAEYVNAGRKLSKNGKTVKRTQIGPDPKEVRAWAASQGMTVPERGRIPANVLDAFNAR